MKVSTLAIVLALTLNYAYAETVQLRILETTDVHANIMDYDFYKDEYTPRYGFTRSASLIKQLQNEVKNHVLVDNGDLIQGSPMGDWAYNTGLPKGQIHPAMKALNTMQYTVGSLGNHEFNYGLAFLQKTLAAAKFPYINANVYDLASKKNYFTPYVIIDTPVVDQQGDKHTLKIGYIGFVPPQIMSWDKNNLDGKVYVDDITETAKKFVPQMRKEGADIVIAVAHSGLSADPYKLKAENSVYYLSEVKGIDAILFGHTHSLFPGKTFDGIDNVDNVKGLVNGIPAVMPGQWGDHVGLIDLTLEKSANRWQVIEAKAEAKPIYDTVNKKELVSADKTLTEVLTDDFTQTRAYVNKIIGKTPIDLSSDLALVQDDITLQIINNAQMDYLAHFIQGDPDLADLPLIAAAAPFKAGGRKNDPTAYIEITEGNLSVKSVNDLYVYPNTLAAITLKGSNIKEWLECSAGLFNQIDVNKSAPQYLINWDKFRLFNFDVIDGGVRYEIDVTQPARYDANCQLVNGDSQRIKNLTYNGQSINPEQKFIMVMNNYRAFTGIFPGSGEANVVVNSPDMNQEVIARYIVQETQQKGELKDKIDNNWKLSAITSPTKLDIRIETSPTEYAKRYIAEHSQYPMTYIENDNIGYAVYRIDLQHPK